MPETKGLPRLCFVGPMLGQHEGWVTTQGEILTHLMAREGYPVRMTSSIISRLPRLADMVRSLIMWRNQIDVVVLSVFSGPAFIPVEATSFVSKALGLPLVYVLRGGRLPTFAKKHPKRVRRVFDRAKVIISPSGYMAHFFNQWGYDLRVIPNVLDIQNYPYCHREAAHPRLLWMRTFHQTYHPEMAVEAFNLVLKELPDATLTMAGQEKGLLETTRRLADSLGLSSKIRFPGFLDVPAKQCEFSTHDIYLHTNRSDNMPVSVVEACAFGLPVVATRVGGIPFLLTHEKDALLVESDDAKAMADAVVRLVREPDLTARLSTNGRELAEQSSWDTILPQWQQIFDEVLHHG